jgi:CrcB protein
MVGSAGWWATSFRSASSPSMFFGSCEMGLVAGWFAFREQASQELRLFLTTGNLGGFTTFSAFSLDAALLYQRGQPWLAAADVAASVVLSIGGLFAALWGMRIWST